jgi:hypothetical protein
VTSATPVGSMRFARGGGSTPARAGSRLADVQEHRVIRSGLMPRPLMVRGTPVLEPPRVRLRILVSFQMLPDQPAQELLDAAAPADRLGLPRLLERRRDLLQGCVAPIWPRPTHRTDPTQPRCRADAGAGLTSLQLAAPLDELSDGRAEIVLGIGNIADARAISRS